MDRLAEMTKERMFLLSAIVGDEKGYEEQSNCQHEIDDHWLLEQSFPKWAFIENRYNDDSTNWWIPNYTAFSSMVRSAGPRIIEGLYSTYRPAHLSLSPSAALIERRFPCVAEPQCSLGWVGIGIAVVFEYGEVLLATPIATPNPIRT